MNYRLIILIQCTFSWLNPTFSQVSDDFADGDFIQNPAWIGHTENFTVNPLGQLQLLAPAIAGSSYIATVSGISQNAWWSFFIQLNFNPSSSKYADVFLISDKENLQEPLNGYFVRIGNTQDEVSLYRKDGALATKIIDGVDGRVKLNTVALNIKVTKNQSNIWELFVDPLLDNSFISEGTIVDGSYFYSAYFGLNCVYTLTQSDKFFFDNVMIAGDVFTDDAAPVADSLRVFGDSALVVYFNEPLESNSALNVQNYFIDHNIGTPGSVLLENGKTVNLQLDDLLMESGTYYLTIHGVKDVFGNSADGSIYPFTYSAPFNPGFGDLIITEIMADPSPEVDLPLWEYLEVYNPHDEPITFSGLKLIVGSDTAKIPTIPMDVGEYLILCQSAAATDLGRYGKTVIIPGWPTLNNDGESIQLINAKDQLVFSAAFDLTSYQSIDKDDGGWSLEMIDPHFPCKEKENWTASIDVSGGTPGRQNSVSESLTDFTCPEIAQVIGVDQNSVLVKFNEKLYPENPDISEITISPSTVVSEAYFIMPTHDQLQIITESALAEKTNYQLTLMNIGDCAGNISDELTATFVLSEPADSLDLIINEVLFNPPPGGVDFVEIYNNSDKTIDLQNWAFMNTTKGIITQGHYTLAPQQFLAITSDGALLKNYYPSLEDNTWIQAVSFPGFNDDNGEITLQDAHGKTMDFFQYSEDMHSPFLKDKEGVSLERIDYDGASNASSNWQSASESVGFATPGRQNSQHLSTSQSDDVVSVEPAVFDPGSSDTDSFTLIKCRFPEPGNMATISIIDATGRMVKKIAQQQSVGTEEDFKWEGDSDTGAEVRIGSYIVYLEVYDANGSRTIYRKRVVVAGRF